MIFSSSHNHHSTHHHANHHWHQGSVLVVSKGLEDKPE
jgi:hypothetical protein